METYYRQTGQTSDLKSHLLTLPVDILTLIADHLTVTSSRQLGLTHRVFHRSTCYRLLRDLSLSLEVSNFGPTRRLLDALEAGQWLPAVRTLKVQDHTYDRHRPYFKSERDEITDQAVRDQRINAVCHASSKMTGLSLLEWQSSQIPISVLHYLSASPLVKLSAHFRERIINRPVNGIIAPDNNLLHRLSRNANLQALDIQLTYVKADESVALMRPLKKVLLTCMNLRKLKLDVHVPTGGCCVYDVPTQYHGLGFMRDEKPVALEELDLVAYPFGCGSQTMTYLDQAYGVDDELDKEPIFWAEKFDWSRLSRLSVYPGVFALKAAPYMVALREVTLGDGHACHQFLLNVPTGLESVNIQRYRLVLLPALLRHRETLRKLVMHAEEGYRQDWTLQCPVSSQLHRIGTFCILLEELEIDSYRTDGDWPYAALDTIASFPKLQQLTLWFALPLASAERDGEPERPFHTFTAAAMLFKYLRLQGSKVRELVIHSGAPHMVHLSDAVDPAQWAHGNSTSFLCALSAQDPDSTDDLFTTTCVEADEQANQWMRAQEGQTSTIDRQGRDMD